ncbi:MAG TPA: phage terminase large subunit [Steroidobacteraceae bacterium]|nr:phage terminase large subunit [Steroidobacteraceae bacterium]
MLTELKFSAFQQRVLGIAEEINLALLGGKSGGKSTVMAGLMCRNSDKYGPGQRQAYFRRSFPAMRDFEETTRNVFWLRYGNAAAFSINDHRWRLPTGSTVEFSQLESIADLQKVQGRSLATIFVDEAGQFPSPALIDMLRINLRAPQGVPKRTVIAANPGDCGQAWLYKRFIAGKEPWKAYRDEFGEWWMWCPSDYRDNEFLNPAEALRSIEVGARGNQELLNALRDGSFLAKTGAFFGLVLDEHRSAVGPFPDHEMPVTLGERWMHWLAHDYGSSAPSVTLLLARSPGAEYCGKFYPRGSVVVLDEFATYQPDDLNEGIRLSVPALAERIKERLCTPWKISAQGVADDAIFSETGKFCIANEFASAGVSFYRARKGGRVAGWQRVCRMLEDAGKPDRPGLYISRDCSYGWSTLPFLPRDKSKLEDVDSRGPDHFADSLRYGLLYEPPVVGRLKIGFAM